MVGGRISVHFEAITVIGFVVATAVATPVTAAVAGVKVATTAAIAASWSTSCL